jgi:hypothetical protein
VDWIGLAQDMYRQRVLVNMVINRRVPQNVRIFSRGRDRRFLKKAWTGSVESAKRNELVGLCNGETGLFCDWDQYSTRH